MIVNYGLILSFILLIQVSDNQNIDLIELNPHATCTANKMERFGK